jgi:hypothetical protein
MGIKEIVRRHHRLIADSRGWTVFKKGTTYEVSQTVALNKMSDISFTWQVENDAVTATNTASLALCGAQQSLPAFRNKMQ